MMDEMDRHLVSALRHDARASLSQLASVLGWSRATVRSRLARLRDSGEIIGFSVVLKSERMRDPVRALMMIAIEGRGTERILRQLGTMPEARAVHTTNGRWDVVVEIGAATLEALDDVLFRVRRLEGITASETSLLLATRKDA
jgi:DNA-binding Lrp family transcriptional regulator